jgi:hypothetical protein
MKFEILLVTFALSHAVKLTTLAEPNANLFDESEVFTELASAKDMNKEEVISANLLGSTFTASSEGPSSEADATNLSDDMNFTSVSTNDEDLDKLLTSVDLSLNGLEGLT